MPSHLQPLSTSENDNFAVLQIDPADSSWYLNRELTWLAFKHRVLMEAADERVPLLERLKFIAIVSSNIDEFFMKRIGGLKQQIGAGVQELTPDGRTPRQQVIECYEVVRQLEAEKDRILAQVLQLLRQKGIIVARYHDLSAKEKKQVSEYYQANIFPLLTPQSIDPAHPFPFISNLSINLLVDLAYPGAKKSIMARVKVPVGLGTPRFIRVGTSDHFVRLEDVIMHNLDGLFPQMQVSSCSLFRVTRNANTEKNEEEEADDLMAMIESELKERKFAPIVRLEVEPGMSPLHRGRLASELNLNEGNDVFEAPVLLAMLDLMEIARLEHPRLHDPPHYPVDHHLLHKSRSIFHIIREAGSILLQHPYESFATSVERLLREAASDPKVVGIKMTLYRTRADGSILDSLVEAAQKGKQVAVVIELKARFDEQANIRLAERMEEVGIHVTFGVVGLKTYCKAIMIVRQDYDRLRRYVHLGTGNYHPDKSREFCDIGLLTCDEAIGQDVTELFNYLTTGFSGRRKFTKLIVAPKSLKKAIVKKIEREALHAANGGGYIRFKTNALEDCDIVEALYRASMAGVKIDLIVRDTCRLRPGIPGLSENIRVVSLVGRFMEHSRIYHFRNGGEEEYFIGSADLMKRNLEARIELFIPIEAPDLKRELDRLLDLHLADQRQSWDMQPDGSYVQRRPPANDSRGEGIHQALILRADQRSKEVAKEKRIRR